MTRRWSRAARPRVMWTAGRRRLVDGRFMVRIPRRGLVGPSAVTPHFDRREATDSRATDVLEGNEECAGRSGCDDFADSLKNAGWTADPGERSKDGRGTPEG